MEAQKQETTEIKKGLPSSMTTEENVALRESIMEGRDENFRPIDPDKGNSGEKAEATPKTSKADSKETSKEQPSNETADGTSVEFDFSTLKGEDKTNAENWQKSLTEKSQALADEKRAYDSIKEEHDALLDKYGEDGIKLGLQKEKDEFAIEKSKYNFDNIQTILNNESSMELLNEVVDYYNEDHPDEKIDNPFSNLVTPNLTDSEKGVMDERAKIRADKEEIALMGVDSSYADNSKKINQLWNFAIEGNLPSLVVAHKVQSYDSMSKQLKETQIEVKELKSKLDIDAIPTVGTKTAPPQSEQIDVTKLSPEERSQRAKTSYLERIKHRR